MTDTTITKIDSTHSPKGAAGQKYLACGKSMSMRLWENENSKKDQSDTKRNYETIGFVIKGKAELHLEGQIVLLNAGDSWVVPKGASHHYKILEEFSAVESTSPPAELHDRSKEDQGLSPKEFFEIGAHDAEAVKSAEPVKGASADVKAKAQTETKADEQAKPQSPGDQATPKDVSDGKPQAEAPAKQTGEEETKKPNEKEDDDQGQTCDPNTHECKPGKQDGEEGKKENEEPPAKDNQSDKKAEQAQKIAAEIPRTESEPTSNSPAKEAKPAEHQDVGDKN